MIRLLKIFLLLTVPAGLLAQETTDETTPVKKKAFPLGILVGSHFANKYTANAYNGYGFDLESKQNNFANSWMYQKIVMQYGGGYGGTDQVAMALGVNHSDWTFEEDDMPANMR